MEGLNCNLTSVLIVTVVDGRIQSMDRLEREKGVSFIIKY